MIGSADGAAGETVGSPADTGRTDGH